MFLHQRERAGHAPGDSEAVLFDLALALPMIIGVLAMMVVPR